MNEDENMIEQIEEYYNDLPQEVKDAILSSDLPNKFKNIADKHGLNIDELGMLRNEAMVVMLGIEPSSRFKENIKADFNINEKTALDITKDIHDQIFNPVKQHLIAWEEEENKKQSKLDATADVSPLERAGGFSLEDESGVTDKEADSLHASESKDNLLEGLENPSAKNLVGVPNYNLNTNIRKEPLADHLLRQMSGNSKQEKSRINQSTPQSSPDLGQNSQQGSTPTQTQPRQRPLYTGNDPYRESVGE